MFLWTRKNVVLITLPIIFCRKSAKSSPKIRKFFTHTLITKLYFSPKILFHRNVPLDLLNAVLINLWKFFCQKSENNSSKFQKILLKIRNKPKILLLSKNFFPQNDPLDTQKAVLSIVMNLFFQKSAKFLLKIRN